MKSMRVILVFFAINIILIFLMHAWGRFAPSAQYLAYTLIDEDYNPHIMLYDFNTGLTLELTSDTDDGRLYGRTPMWSTDGRKIAYRTFRNRGDLAVYEFDVEQGMATNLTETNDTINLPIYTSDEGYALFTSNDIVLMSDPPQTLAEIVTGVAAFSPDGRYLAYLALENREYDESIAEDSRIPNDPSEFDIWLYDMQTDERWSLTQNINTHGNPIWSPDSSKIAFRSIEFPLNDVHIIDIATSSIRSHDTNMYATSPPSWSPDNQHLTFASGQQAGNLDIFTLNIESGEITQHTTHTSYDIQPSWSSNGEWISFVSHRNGQDDLYALHVATGNIRRLTATPLSEADPVWQPK